MDKCSYSSPIAVGYGCTRAHVLPRVDLQTLHWLCRMSVRSILTTTTTSKRTIVATLVVGTRHDRWHAAEQRPDQQAWCVDNTVNIYDYNAESYLVRYKPGKGAGSQPNIPQDPNQKNADGFLDFCRYVFTRVLSFVFLYAVLIVVIRKHARCRMHLT